MHRLAVAWALLVVSLPRISLAAAGALDPDFAGGAGFTTTDFGSFDTATSLVVQADGKLVAAGRTASADFALARVLADGSLDSTFGTGGLVITNAGGFDVALGIAQQPDGKLLVAGRGGAGNSQFVVARYDDDGSLDETFGAGGLVTTSIGGLSDAAEALVLQPDGKIVVAGRASVAGSDDFAIARYSAGGVLDLTFGTAGVTTTDFAGGSDGAMSLVLQPDGKLVLAGRAEAAGSHRFALARYDDGGTLDSSFGTGGLVTTDLPGGDGEARALVLQPDGRLVAAGRVGNELFSNFALARYAANGVLDPSFGNVGVVTTNLAGSFESAYSLVRQTDGKLVAAGGATSPAIFLDIALVRYLDDGSLDDTFGVGGRVTTDFGIDRPEEAFALALQADGRLVAAGFHSSLTSTDFALARYLASTPLPAMSTLGVTLLGGALAMLMALELRARQRRSAASRCRRPSR